MSKHIWMGAFLFIDFFAVCLANAGCGSGACQQSPCVPGIPLLQGTCKCAPTEDGGPALDATPAPASAVP
jgi:hypothetical protein